MTYEIQGKLLEVYDVQQVSDTFRKREFVIEKSEQIPNRVEPIINYVKFQTIQDRTTLIDDFEVGQDITVSFNIRGNKWQNREGGISYFTNLEAWRIVPASQAPAAGAEQATPTQAPNNQGPEPDFNMPEGDDEIPF